MNLLDLIRRPHSFFEALRGQPPRPWRFLWLPLLSGLLGGVGGVLLSRSVLSAQASGAASLPAGLLWVVTAFGSLFGSLVLWLLLWWLGTQGAGRSARAGEVYGASFLVPLLWSLVLTVLALLFPPQVNVPAPDLRGLSGQALLTAVQRYTSAVQAQFSESGVVRFSSFMGYAVYLVQFWLAYIGLRTMTGERRLAWRGVLYPGLLLLALGLASLLVLSAAGSLLGGAR
ncbi:MAG: YIP1 family protein [Deinococcus sp.]